MQYGDEALPTAGRRQLVKMIIMFEPYYLLINVNIVWPLGCKTGTMPC